MPVLTKENILDHIATGQIKSGQRFLGMDLGSKTIGLALSDSLRMTATPVRTLKRAKFSKDILEIDALIKEENIAVIVIGMPTNMDGSEGPRAQSTRQFAQNLLKFNADWTVVFWDERLSTAAVERTLFESGKAKSSHKSVIDKMAASYILQGLLDYLSMN